MPLTPTSFFLPASDAIPYLMEDKYLRGGYRSVVDNAARDAIHPAARKPGMQVYVAATGKTWTFGQDNTWEESKGSQSREFFQFAPSSPVAAGASVDFVVPSGKTALILKLVSSAVDITIEAHSTPARNDANPYTFVAFAGHLQDDGSSKLDDGTTQFNRRYAVVSNLESEPGTDTFWRLINNRSVSETPTIDIFFLTVEA